LLVKNNFLISINMDCISLIVAADEDWAIGRDGGMPWHLSADFKYFKSVTSGHTVIMGRTTWKSLGCRPLPGRRNIVVSSRPASDGDMGAEFCTSLEAAFEMAKGDGEIFVIGGGMVYRQALQRAEKVYLTRVHTRVGDADTYFPYLEPDMWWETSRSEKMRDEKSGFEFEFLVYDRIY